MKSFSKTFNFPLSDNSIQSKQLMQTMQQIAQRQQEYMAEKLLRQAEIQNRLKQLEDNFEHNALKKQEKIKLKLEKSQKNRIQFLQKIVKRCKQKQRVLNEKIKNTNTKRKQSLRQAWKAATQFNQKILEGRLVRHKSQNKEQKYQPQKSQQNLNKSLIIPDYVNEDNGSLVGGVQNNGNMNSHRKNVESGLANRSLFKPYDNGMFQSTFHIQKKLQKLSKPVTIEIQARQSIYEENPENPYNEKLRRTLIRHQQVMMEQENKKIQEYGKRLEKINLSRRKKDEIHKSRLKKSSVSTQNDYDDDEERKRKQEKLNKKHNRRLKSQSQSCQRVKRVNDWSEENQHRRQQLMNAHIEMGNQYLSENKIRYLKEIMSKNIAYNALERKLYEQRMKHV